MIPDPDQQPKSPGLPRQTNLHAGSETQQQIERILEAVRQAFINALTFPAVLINNADAMDGMHTPSETTGTTSSTTTAPGDIEPV